MPEFRYALDYERTYHDLGLVKPGDVVTARKAPDGNWEPVKAAKNDKPPKPDPEPEATADGDTPASEE